MSVVPPGWTKVRIGDICSLKNGRAFKPSEWVSNGLPIVRIQNLNNPLASFNHYDGDFEDRYHLKGGELLFAWSGTPGTSFGAHIWRGGEALLNQHIFRIDFDESSIDKRFLRRAINQKLVELIDIAHGGVGLRHVTKGKFEATEIALAPLAEQKRIADKLDRLLAAVDTCKARLAAIPAILKRFRQSVLAAATSGKLTEEWRAEGQLECAKNLVVRAIEARKRRYESDLARSRDAGSRRPSKPTGIDLHHIEGNALPEGWTWAAPENLCEKIIDGTHHTPTYVEAGVPFLSAKNIRDFEVHFEDCKYVTAAEHQELSKRCRAVRGSLLVTKSGTIGRVAVVETDREFSLFESVAVFTPSTPEISAHYLGYVIALYCLQGDEELLIKGTAVRHLHLEDLRLLRIPLPPTTEQQEIVVRVQGLLRAADELETKLSDSLALLDRITEGLLAKAFRGELDSRVNRSALANISTSGADEASMELGTLVRRRSA